MAIAGVAVTGTAVLALIVSLPATADPLPLFAPRIIDGDTLSAIVDGRRERIRTAGIDAPETGKRARCRAERQREAEARRWLERRLAGARITVELHGRDRYGRLLAEVYADWHSVGSEMVQAGQAAVYERGRSEERWVVWISDVAREECGGHRS